MRARPKRCQKYCGTAPLCSALWRFFKAPRRCNNAPGRLKGAPQTSPRWSRGSPFPPAPGTQWRNRKTEYDAQKCFYEVKCEIQQISFKSLRMSHTWMRHTSSHLRLNRSSGGDSSNGLGSGPPWTRDITTPRASENVVDVPNAAKQNAAVVCNSRMPDAAAENCQKLHARVLELTGDPDIRHRECEGNARA